LFWTPTRVARWSQSAKLPVNNQSIISIKNMLNSFEMLYIVLDPHCKKKVCGSWNQKLYIGEYSGIYSLKLKNSGIYSLRFAPSWIYSWIFRKSFLRCVFAYIQYCTVYIRSLPDMKSFRHFKQSRQSLFPFRTDLSCLQKQRP
jgi:hypothetical protein